MKKVLRFTTLNAKVIIKQDSDAQNPRDNDNLGTCLFFGNHNYLGDKHQFNSNDYDGWESMCKALEKKYSIAFYEKRDNSRE